jgi:hypothetical protein
MERKVTDNIYEKFYSTTPRRPTTTSGSGGYSVSTSFYSEGAKRAYGIENDYDDLAIDGEQVARHAILVRAKDYIEIACCFCGAPLIVKVEAVLWKDDVIHSMKAVIIDRPCDCPDIETKATFG